MAKTKSDLIAKPSPLRLMASVSSMASLYILVLSHETSLCFRLIVASICQMSTEYNCVPAHFNKVIDADTFYDLGNFFWNERFYQHFGQQCIKKHDGRRRYDEVLSNCFVTFFNWTLETLTVTPEVHQIDPNCLSNWCMIEFVHIRSSLSFIQHTLQAVKGIKQNVCYI